MNSRNFLAIDLGASSGRVIAGALQQERLTLTDIHRFDNGGVKVAGRLQWNLLGLWQNILDGLRRASADVQGEIVSVGVDTWGVDFGLLGAGDTLLGNPYHYRDRQTVDVFEDAFKVVSRETIYAETGLQFMELNTLFQLFAMHRDRNPVLAAAESLLMMPDLFHWLLSGEKSCERTNASTTQLLNPLSGNWSKKLIDAYGFDSSIFQPVIDPGTRLGKLRRSVISETGLNQVDVVLPPTHDTASAFLAVPATVNGRSADWCVISSGTWSLMGVELAQPLINQRAAELNFTNEGGAFGTTRFLKNIAGLWLVQECRRNWLLQGKQYQWSELVDMAAASQPLVSIVDPDHPSLVAPANMIDALCDLCKSTGQPVPDSDGALIRCALESLAARYRAVLSHLESLVDHRIETIHIIGGGSQNELLCQMTADACDRQVLAGPVEGTALGNLLMQALAANEVSSLPQAREIVRASFPPREYLPARDAAWADACDRLLAGS